MLKGDPRLLDRLPPHKALLRAPAGKGLAIGNLNSRFFANVYLIALEQFAQHGLKARWYLRYCDDFVPLARPREQLLNWRIRAFLREHLALQLNDARERLIGYRFDAAAQRAAAVPARAWRVSRRRAA